MAVGPLPPQVKANQTMENVIKQEIVELSICDVFFTQSDCSSTFRDGRPLDITVQGLRDRLLDPLSAEFLILTLFR